MYVRASAAAARGGNARESIRRAGSEMERGKYRLMTLIWEVGTSLRVIFIIHAMSWRSRGTAAVGPAGEIAISPNQYLVIAKCHSLALRHQLDFFVKRINRGLRVVPRFIWTQRILNAVDMEVASRYESIIDTNCPSSRCTFVLNLSQGEKI